MTTEQQLQQKMDSGSHCHTVVRHRVGLFTVNLANAIILAPLLERQAGRARVGHDVAADGLLGVCVYIKSNVEHERNTERAVFAVSLMNAVMLQRISYWTS
jgi:hypothetical protein